MPVFSPHGLRHRRIGLLHAQGISWAEIGRLVGQRKLLIICRAARFRGSTRAGTRCRIRCLLTETTRMVEPIGAAMRVEVGPLGFKTVQHAKAARPGPHSKNLAHQGRISNGTAGVIAVETARSLRRSLGLLVDEQRPVRRSRDPELLRRCRRQPLAQQRHAALPGRREGHHHVRFQRNASRKPEWGLRHDLVGQHPRRRRRIRRIWSSLPKPSNQPSTSATRRSARTPPSSM